MAFRRTPGEHQAARAQLGTSDYLADALLQPLTGAIFVQQRRGDGIERDRIKNGIGQLVRRALGSAGV